MKHCYVHRWCYPALRPPRFSRHQDPSAGIRPWNRKEPPQNEIHAEMSIIGRSVAFRNGPFLMSTVTVFRDFLGLSGLWKALATCWPCWLWQWSTAVLDFFCDMVWRSAEVVHEKASQWEAPGFMWRLELSDPFRLSLKYTWNQWSPLWKKWYLQENPKIPICWVSNRFRNAPTFRLPPCWECCKALVAAGVARVLFKGPFGWAIIFEREGYFSGFLFRNNERHFWSDWWGSLDSMDKVEKDLSREKRRKSCRALAMTRNMDEQR